MKEVKNPVKSVENSILILHQIKNQDGARISTLVDEIGLTKGAVHNHLKTLEKYGLVVQNDKEYKLGLEFISFGEYARNHCEVYKEGKEPVNELAESTGEYAHLTTEQHGRSIKLYKVAGSKAVGNEYQVSKLENPEHLHHTATGKAILAFLPKQRVAEIIEQYGLPNMTKNTITNKETLFDQLETIRERGFALNDEEEIEGIRAVGSPICDRDEKALGAVSISAPKRRMPDKKFQEDIPDMVMRTANVIEANIHMAERTQRNLDVE